MSTPKTIADRLIDAGRAVKEKFDEMASNSEKYAEDVFLRKPIEPIAEPQSPRPGK